MPAIDFPSSPTTGQVFKDSLVRDSFNRADSTSTMGSTDTGQTWVPNSGTWGITSNAAYRSSVTSQSTTVVDSGLSDCVVEATMSTYTGGADAGLCFRSTDDNNNYVMSYDALWRRQGGTYTMIGLLGTGIQQGDVLKVELKGSTIKVSVNNVRRLIVIDVFNETATKHGLRINGGTVAIDNFSISDITSNVWTYNGSLWELADEDAPMRMISKNTKNAYAAIGTSTTSASYVAMTGGPSVSFNKEFSAAISSIVVTVSASTYHSGVATAQFAVGVINNTTYDVNNAFHNSGGIHRAFTASKEITGVAAGTYTIALYWRTGGGTLTVDGNDTQSITVREKLLDFP